MTQSMKDLLLGLGFKPSATAREPEARTRPAAASRRERPRPHADARGRPTQSQDARPQPARPRPEARARSEEDFDLARAFALRAQQEKREREAAERQRQEAAQRKREAKAKVVQLLVGQTRNDTSAEIARHFEYNGKIRRVHVTAEQLKALNAGELAVVQIDGRYLLVDAAIAAQVHALLPSLIALRIDPQAPAADDPYADPRYAIPDDLVW